MILNYMNLGQNRFPKIKSNNQYNEIRKFFSEIIVQKINNFNFLYIS